jgi:hypothetical protein
MAEAGMAETSWIVSDPTPDPFAAICGDNRKYVVHFCEVSHLAESEWVDVFAGFLLQAFEAAMKVQRSEARRIVLEVDPVYSLLTVVVTDTLHTYDEREVFKLKLHDWDAELNDQSLEDDQYALASKQLMKRFQDVATQAMKSPTLNALVSDLHARQFTFWFTEYREHEDWAELRELPAS